MVRNLWKVCNILYTGNKKKIMWSLCLLVKYLINFQKFEGREISSCRATSWCSECRYCVTLWHTLYINKDVNSWSVCIPATGGKCPSTTGTSLQQAPLYKGHLSTIATPYNGHCFRAATHFHPNQEICSYFNLPATATSLQWPVNSVASPQGGCCRKVPL